MDDAIDDVLSRFSGTIEQVPPMYSALKREGRPLYELARAGIEVERAPRKVVIHRLRRVELSGDALLLDVECSKGTYVRVLAEDIGEALGLRRASRRVAADASRAAVTGRCGDVGSARVDAACRRDARALRPVDALLDSLPRVELDESMAGRFRQGQRLALDAQPKGARVRVYAQDCELLGTANVNEWGVVAPERLISNERALT